MFKKVDSVPASNDAKSEGAPAPKPKPSFEKSYGTFAYRLLGARFEKGAGSELLAERLVRAGMDITPGMYNSVMYLTTILGTVGAFAFSFLLFHYLIVVPDWYAYVALITGVTLGAILAGFQFVISSRIANRKDQLDRELPFTLSELSVLASTGMSPIQLVRRFARRDHDPAMTLEFKRVIYRTDVEGKDLITALAETAKGSPSQSVRESFWDLANMIHQGGNLDEYLRAKSDDVLRLKRLVQKEFIERLSTFLDMYVSLVLVGVLMIAVGAFLINALGSTAAGLDSNELLLLLTFGFVPVAVAMTIILISIAYARAE
ncbi:MAG TPA: type II secretion system F family protein [Thermoplasmata archaeon]|nr:type II secretion system F family protein [Thermoplasmata archaeon]